MATSTMTGVQVTPVIPVVHTLPPPPPSHLRSSKGLAITQLVIGIVTIIFGIAAAVIPYFPGRNVWATGSGAGVWAGVWFAVTGVIGVCPVWNSNINGVYMVFSIISTCSSGLSIIFINVVVIFFVNDECSYCSYKEAPLAIHVPLLLLMILEFFVSIVAAVYCCKSCCGQGTQGTLQYGGQMVLYGGQIAPQYGGQIAPQYGGQIQPQYYAPTYSAQQGVKQPLSTVSTDPMQQTNPTYSEKPPGV